MMSEFHVMMHGGGEGEPAAGGRTGAYEYACERGV